MPGIRQNGYAVGKRPSWPGTCEGIFRAPVPVCRTGADRACKMHQLACPGMGFNPAGIPASESRSVCG